MRTEQEIFEELKALLPDVLGVRPEQVQRSSLLVADLGAESIDLLDLSFQIEDKFKVAIEANEIEREARKRLPGVLYEQDGLLTEEALAEIRARVPGLDPAKLVKGLRKSDFPSLLTVEFFGQLIARKLAEKTTEAAHV